MRTLLLSSHATFSQFSPISPVGPPNLQIACSQKFSIICLYHFFPPTIPLSYFLNFFIPSPLSSIFTATSPVHNKKVQKPGALRSQGSIFFPVVCRQELCSYRCYGYKHGFNRGRKGKTLCHTVKKLPIGLHLVITVIPVTTPSTHAVQSLAFTIQSTISIGPSCSSMTQKEVCQSTM